MNIMRKLENLLSEQELGNVYSHFDALALDLVKSRKSMMELNFVRSWCQQYQEDHNIQFTPEEETSFIIGWQEGFDNALSDLEMLIADNGISDSIQ